MLAKEGYLKTVRRPYPPLFCSLVCMGYSDAKQFEVILDEPFAVTDMVHADSTWYYGKANLEKSGELALNYWRDPAVFERVQKEFDKRADRLVDAAESSFEEFAQAYQDYMPPLILIFAIDQPTEIKLREALSKHLSGAEVEQLMTELNTPLQDNFHKQEEYDLVTASDLAQHVKGYRWLYARYGEEQEYTLDEAGKKLREIDKDEFLRKWKEEKVALRKSVAHAKKILDDEAYLVDIFQYMVYYRTHRTDVMNKAAFLAMPVLQKKAKSLGITYGQLLRCSGEEVLQNKIPDETTLDSRIEDCTTLLEDGVVTCLEGERSKKIVEFFKEEAKTVSEIKGSIASKGKAKGMARLIFDKDDYGKVNEGDILVTSMTTPEMVPIMKKAAAFVTDEGGVTCHAAIISREMNKPCIIGTKIATQALKDGVEVEVDANEGVVQIIAA